MLPVRFFYVVRRENIISPWISHYGCLKSNKPIPDIENLFLQDYRYHLEISCYALQIIALETYYVTR